MGLTISTVPDPPVQSVNFSMVFADDTLNPWNEAVSYTLTLNGSDFTSYVIDNVSSPATITFSGVNSADSGLVDWFLTDDATPANTAEDTLDIQPICFNKGTRILCKGKTETDKDVDIAVEDIVEGTTIVKVYPEGYRKVRNIIKSDYVHSTATDLHKLYKIPKNAILPNIPYTDTYISGGHSFFTDEPLDGVNTKILKLFGHHSMLTLNGKYRALPYMYDKCVADKEIEHTTIYQIVLENEDKRAQCIVYAHGLMAETTSIAIYSGLTNPGKRLGSAFGLKNKSSSGRIATSSSMARVNRLTSKLQTLLIAPESTILDSYWPVDGIQKTSYKQWVKQAEEAGYNVL